MKRKTVTLAGRRDRPRPGLEDATPERIGQARRHGTAERDAQGVRRIGDPFDALHARALLDREDPAANALLWQAGERLRRHWHAGQMEGLRAFDFTRDSVDTSLAPALTPGEHALRHRDALRAARDHVGPRLWPYLNGVVLDGLPAIALRNLVMDTGHARTQDALVLERLREGLHRLVELWRMRPQTRSGRIGVWLDEAARPQDGVAP